MGLYDSLYVKCPNCETEIEFQSKADDEMFCRNFTFETVPQVILQDLNYQIQECKACLSDVQIQLELKAVGKAVIVGE